MKSAAIFSLLLAVSLAAVFNVRGSGNATLQQQLLIPVMEKKEAGFNPRIAYGYVAATNQFPYQVGLSFKYVKENFWCGGALIANEWVLTAAQCTVGSQSVTVKLGMINLLKPAVEYSVNKSKILVHEKYVARSITADIALIQIPHVNYTMAIQPIGLPRKVLPYPTYVGGNGFISGWGYTSSKSTANIFSLRYAILKIISNSACERFYGKKYIYSGKLCTDDRIGEFCSRDTGGPLISTSQRTLIGIASFSVKNGCGKGYPNAFTRVDYYLNWIQGITKLQL